MNAAHLLTLQEKRDQAEHARDTLWLDLCQRIADLAGADFVTYHDTMHAIRRFGYESRCAEREHARISALLRIDPGLTP